MSMKFTTLFVSNLAACFWGGGASNHIKGFSLSYHAHSHMDYAVVQWFFAKKKKPGLCRTQYGGIFMNDILL